MAFEVDAALVVELGEKLVARKSVALAELIKNAYDADATEVVVTFDRVCKPEGSITVEDNGVGMTFETLRRTWMRIATDQKLRNPYSPRYRRPTTGAKGVGRFAAARLSQELILQSVAQVDEVTWEQVTVRFDWSQYRPGADLRQVEHHYEVRRSNTPLPTGVKLMLQRLRDTWAESDFREVMDDLLYLTPPYSAPEPGFSVRFVAPEFPEYEGRLSDKFLEAATAKLRGRVSENGTPVYTLTFRDEKRTLSFEAPETRFPALVGAECIVHLFLFERRELGSGIRVGTAADVGRRHGGVRIYLDG
ncbi:MAG: ATP-binding protein, partial [Bacillota bacterium]